MDLNFRKVLRLSELGNHLKQARLEKNYSLDDLQRITKIQKRYLVGIEEGNYAVMPGNFYVRAFIKQYAEAVGLDSEELFEQFNNEIPNTYDDDLPDLSRIRTHQQVPKSASKFLEVLPRVLMVTGILVVAIIVWILVQNMMNNDQSNDMIANDEPKEVNVETSEVTPSQTEEDDETKTEEEPKDNEQKEQDVEQLKQQLTVSKTTKSETIYELKNTDKMVLKVSAKGDTWIEVRNNKKDVFFRKMMYENQEETLDLSNESQIHIVIGNAINTTIFINDQQVSYEIDPKDEVRQDMTILYTKS